MGSQPRLQKLFLDFNETFSVDRAFHPECFDKIMFLKSFCFHRENLKTACFTRLKKRFH